MGETHYEAKLDKAIDDFLGKYHQTQLPSQSTIDGWLEDKGEEYVIELFNYITSKDQPLDQPTGYMRAVVKSDWEPYGSHYTKGQTKKNSRPKYVSPLFKAAKERLEEDGLNNFEVYDHDEELVHILIDDDLKWLYRNIDYEALETEEEKEKHFWIYYGMLKCLGITKDLVTFTHHKRDIYGYDKYKYYYKIYDERSEAEKEEQIAIADKHVKKQIKGGAETMAKSEFREKLEKNLPQFKPLVAAPTATEIKPED